MPHARFQETEDPFASLFPKRGRTSHSIFNGDASDTEIEDLRSRWSSGKTEYVWQQFADAADLKKNKIALEELEIVARDLTGIVLHVDRNLRGFLDALEFRSRNYNKIFADKDGSIMHILESEWDEEMQAVCGSRLRDIVKVPRGLWNARPELTCGYCEEVVNSMSREKFTPYAEVSDSAEYNHFRSAALQAKLENVLFKSILETITTYLETASPPFHKDGVDLCIAQVPPAMFETLGSVHEKDGWSNYEELLSNPDLRYWNTNLLKRSDKELVTVLGTILTPSVYKALYANYLTSLSKREKPNPLHELRQFVASVLQQQFPH